MTININMINSTDRSKFHSDHQLRFTTDEGLTCIMVSGMVALGFGGQRDGWKKEDFIIDVKIPSPPAGKVFKLRSWVPIVTSNSVQNENHAVGSGHAVTRFSLQIPDDRLIAPTISFVGEVGVRDVDQIINSLAYHATILGEYIDTPEDPGGEALI